MTETRHSDGPESPASQATNPIDRRAILRGLGGVGALAASLGGAGMTAARQDAGSQVPPVDGTESDAGEAPAALEELFVPPSQRSALPESSAQTAGRIRWLTDDDRGLWLDTGEGWISLGGHVFDVRAFGATGDGETDDWSAFQTALEAMTSPLLDDSSTPYGRTLLVPPGRYRLAQSLVLNRAVRLLGTGAGQFGDAILMPDPGMIGIIIEEADPLTGGPNGRQAEGAIIERLQIESASSTAGTTPGEPAPTETTPSETGDATGDTAADGAHGVWLQAGATLRRCAVLGFGGDGIHVEAPEGNGGSPDGAPRSAWAVDDCRVDGCGGHGLFADGDRPGVCSLLEATGNGGWGIQDESDSGNTYVQCRAGGNGLGPFRSVGGGNRSLFLNCTSERGQKPGSFVQDTIVVGGRHGATFEGGNAWTANGSRVLVVAQDPGTGEPGLETAPTLEIRGTIRQQQPHMLISDSLGSRHVEVDVTGRVFVGPLAPDSPVGGTPASDAVRLQVSGGPEGSAGLRWVMVDEDAPFTGWVAQATAFQDTGGPDAPNVAAGFGAVRLTFQTPAGDGSELDTLTLRGGRVGIGTTAPAAALDVASSTQGFLPPRMTTEQRDAIQTPPEGSLIYNITTKRLNFHDGTQWQEPGATVGG
ncbi:MAG TPA: glycosyl hydrolase family 28-related protein [Thermomicrobiales bacterium]|nr:glycosyl hydrolase family 28-related protein [Thermomicrobiales bacterium]